MGMFGPEWMCLAVGSKMSRSLVSCASETAQPNLIQSHSFKYCETRFFANESVLSHRLAIIEFFSDVELGNISLMLFITTLVTRR